MSARIDEVGNSYGLLKVLKHVEKGIWLCKCQCGNKTEVKGIHLRSGGIKSCGCLFYSHKIKHGDTTEEHSKNGKRVHTRIYRTWVGLKSRCLNKNNKDYHKYGGRGITVHTKWKNNYAAFRDYVLNLPNAPENEIEADQNISLDRKNNDKGYLPGNLRWITKREQTANRRNSVRYKYKGKERTLREISDITGLPYELLNSRIYDRGKTIQEAVAMGKSQRKGSLLDND